MRPLKWMLRKIGIEYNRLSLDDNMYKKVREITGIGPPRHEATIEQMEAAKKIHDQLWDTKLKQAGHDS
jgi:hypothetical protein